MNKTEQRGRHILELFAEHQTGAELKTLYTLSERSKHRNKPHNEWVKRNRQQVSAYERERRQRLRGVTL